jgi:hypothetical protein
VVAPNDFAYLGELWRVDESQLPERTIGEDGTQQFGPKYTTDRAIDIGCTVDCEG